MPYNGKLTFQFSQAIVLLSTIGNLGAGIIVLGQTLMTGGETCRSPNGAPCSEISTAGLLYGSFLIMLSLLMFFYVWRGRKAGVLLTWLGITALWFILGSGLNYGLVANAVLMGGWITLRALAE